MKVNVLQIGKEEDFKKPIRTSATPSAPTTQCAYRAPIESKNRERGGQRDTPSIAFAKPSASNNERKRKMNRNTYFTCTT